MGQLFSGQLEVNQAGATLNGQSVKFMFNPTEYSISKSNKWENKANKSGNVPKWEFGGGDPRQMSIELFFDFYLPRPGVSADDVRAKTNMLFKFMMIDKALKGAKSKMGQPPACRLVWGKIRNTISTVTLCLARSGTPCSIRTGCPSAPRLRLL